MDRRSLDFLEFPQLLEHLKSLAISELGRRASEEVTPLLDPEAVEAALEETAQMKGYIEERGGLPEVGFRDVSAALERAALGAVLSPEELLAVAASIRASVGLKRALEGAGERFWRLRDIGRRLHAPEGVASEIEGAITPRGEIRDEASLRLSEIRGRIKGVKERIRRRLEEILQRASRRGIVQTDLITQRNDRFVLLVRSDAKGRMEGIVHDVSGSGASLYLEPMEVVELNNELGLLRQQEREEEERILKYLSSKVAERAPQLRADLGVQVDVDLLYAKALLAQRLGAHRPAVNSHEGVRLIGARHPLLLLRGEDVVPVDLVLRPEQKVLIISGANAGGKTVALKTLGLLVLMAQSGMLIPASPDSTLQVFKKVFAYIGDEQSLREHLSTFSSFILWAKEVLDEVDPSSLVLIDEIGTGTDYAQGSALAMAILDEIRRKDGYAVVTTHLEPLKAYGYKEEGVQNAAVEFDPETMTPTYRLLYGQAGRSWTFPIAERWGLQGEVIGRAKEYHRQVSSPEEGLLEELQELRGRLEEELRQAERIRLEASERRERLRELFEGLRQRRREVLKRVEEHGKRRLRELEERLREVLREAERRPERGGQLRGEMRRAREEFLRAFPKRRSYARPAEVRVGDWVEIASLGRRGRVVEFGHERAEVLVGAMRVKVPLEELRESEPEGGKEVALVGLEAEGRGVQELNVVGLRVEEALPKVEKLIDEAILRGWDQVQIVHGIGSGRLRRAIREHLKGMPWVKELKSAPLERGGGGVTIVELK